MASTTLYCPVPGTYGIAQLDIEATIEHLDSEAREAAKHVKPAQCFIYFYLATEFPFPSRPWTRYITYIVGPGLRAVDQDNCFTPEMCVPIFPATKHPNQRAPLYPETPFPFTNCYHWAYTDLLLRVSTGEYPCEDDPRVTMLPAGEHLRLDALLTEDLEAAMIARRERDGGQLIPTDEDDNFIWRPDVPDEQIPVVNVSLDLAGTLEQDNLPDPMEFLRESKALRRLVRESNMRKKDAIETCPGYDDAASLPASCMRSSEDISITGTKDAKGQRYGGLLKICRAFKRLILPDEPSRTAREEEDEHAFTYWFDEESEISAINQIPEPDTRSE